MTKIYIYLVLTVIGLGGLGGAFYMIKKNGELEAELAINQETLEHAVNYYTGEIITHEAAFNVLNDAYTESYNEREKFAAMLAEHDLETLARKKPGLVTTRINDATARVFMAIETASQTSTTSTGDEPSKTKASDNEEGDVQSGRWNGLF